MVMQFNPMEKNSQLLNMKPIIYFNFIPFIHKSSIFYTSIRIHQDYKSLKQGSGEMALFLHYWAMNIISNVGGTMNIISIIYGARTIYWRMHTWSWGCGFLNHSYVTLNKVRVDETMNKFCSIILHIWLLNLQQI